MRYADKLVEKADNNSLVKLAKEVVDSITSGSQDLNSAYEIINQAIGKLDKKLVIFLDDLDRLDKTEIFEVLRLVRNTADFKNTFFVLAYDRAYVEEALRDANIPKSERYLEKIVQTEACLPYVEETVIKRELKKRLDLFFEHKFSGQPKEIDKYKQITYDVIYKIPEFKFYTLREVLRFCNSFTLNVTAIINDVCVVDYMLLEYLRMLYPNVYEKLKASYDIIFGAPIIDFKDVLKELELDPKQSMAVIESLKIENKDAEKIIRRLFNKQYDRNLDNAQNFWFPIRLGSKPIKNAQHFYRYFKVFAFLSTDVPVEYI
jgi:predicted KAP-like P-loop ATPase